MTGQARAGSKPEALLVGSPERASVARRVEVFDRNFVRLRRDLGVPRTGPKVESLLELYLYFPGALDVNRFTLARDDFYRQLHAYLSLEIPGLTVDTLLDPAAPASPLCRLGALLERLEADSGRAAALTPTLVEEAKVYGCLAGHYLRDQALGLKAALDAPGGEAPDDVELRAWVEALGPRARSLPQAFRALQARLRAAPALPGPVRAALAHVDEYLSHQVGKCLTRVVHGLERSRPALAADLRGDLLTTMREERAYRQRAGFHFGSSVGADDGSFLRHIELLEDAVESAMVLTQRREAGSEKFSDWIGGFAAAVAMAFAFVVANMAAVGTHGGMDPLVFAVAIVTYIFKDRIKDVIKRRLTSDRRGWFPDLDTHLLDRETGAVLGRSFETVRWLGLSEVPPVIEAVRSHRSLTTRQLREATGETVLRYTKRMQLDPYPIYLAHDRQGVVVEKLSLDLERFVQAARPARVELLALTPEGDGVRALAGHRTYLINLIARYGVAGGGEVFEKVRIYADEDGPVRVETVIPPCREEDLARLDAAPAPDWIRPPPEPDPARADQAQKR